MKIHGHGSHSGRYGSSQQESPRAREFRKRYSVGQRLKGTVLTRPNQGMAWIDIQGCELLASLKTSASPGEELLFLVTQLHPRIVLKEIAPGGINRELGNLIQQFVHTRLEFEDALAGRTWFLHLPRSYALRKRAFAAKIKQDPASGLFLALQGTEHAINHIVGQTGGHEFSYAPWVFPDARRSESLLSPPSPSPRAPGNRELLFGLVHPSIGPVRIHTLARPPELLYRFFLADTSLQHDLEKWLLMWVTPPKTLKPRSLGAFELEGHNSSLLDGLVQSASRSGIDIQI